MLNLVVLLTAIGVGGATVIGAIIGFLLKKPSHKFSDLIISFAAGVMLAAAVIGLILPSLEYNSGALALLLPIAGIFCGAICLNVIDKIVPHLHSVADAREKNPSEKAKPLNKVMLFVIAIAIHNLPEGIAAGVSFGTDNISHALTVSISIALQNIPEGMIIIAPMLSAGVSTQKAFLIALGTGMVEVLGTFLGYFAVTFSNAILPFALSFAGGTMLYIISDEMIPESHSHKFHNSATYCLIVGFCLMLVIDFLLA